MHNEVKSLRYRIEMLESAVEMLEERLSTLMETQYLEPYILELSDEDVQKIKDWLNNEDN
jgi:archaellum component FlaC